MKRIVYCVAFVISLQQVVLAQTAPKKLSARSIMSPKRQAARRMAAAKSIPAVKSLTPISSVILATSVPVSLSPVAESTTDAAPAGRDVLSYGSIPIQDHNVIRSYYLDLAFNKTTCIIFNSPIKSVDLGSKDIMADKASAVDNVLRVKASSIGFNETNFSVMTADGKFHSFVANYNEYPTMLALDLSASDDRSVQQKGRTVNQKGTVVSFAGVNTSQQEIVQNCARIIDQHRRIRHIGTNKYDIQASLRGLYYKDNVLYYKVGVKNKSNINYDLEYMRFFIVDKTVAKESSHQELEITPLYVYNEPLVIIPGRQSVEKVYVFQKFTIPDDKTVQIVMGEKNGGRTVSFSMANQDILDADTL